MSTYIELEIQNLLNEVEDVSQVAQRLIEGLENSSEYLNAENIAALARFLINSKQAKKLIEFILLHINNENFPVPWPYFLEALGMAEAELSQKTLQALLEGIQENQSEMEAARSQALAHRIPALREWQGNRNYKIHKDYSNNKALLLEQLITLRTQQLYEQEKQLLQRLQKLYPGDKEIKKEINEHKQRYALEILQRRPPKTTTFKSENYQPADPALDKTLQSLLKSFLEQAEQHPDMAFDFAIAAFMLESYDTALDLLSWAEPTPSVVWLHLEALLKCRRFIELLIELTQAELAFSEDPETFFATAYLRAQAYWGLGQKHTAIEILEGLLAARPQYRAASTLLSIWRGA